MSSKYNRQKLLKLYKYPLPVDIILKDAVFPPIVPHNPVSWLIFLYQYINTIITNTKHLNKSNPDIGVVYEQKVYKILLPQSSKNDQINLLWQNGFFGKGILSRSEPTWYIRSLRKFGLIKDYSMDDLTSEEITVLRRNQRKEFKKLREENENKILLLENEISNKFKSREELKKLSDELMILKSKKFNSKDFQKFIKSQKDNNLSLYNDSNLRKEDQLLMNEDESLKQIEYFQLLPEEVLFLNTISKIKTINANPINLKLILSQSFEIYNDKKIRSSNSFLLSYLVYYHYRSQGWCIRSGIKFGTDYLLYKNGPPLSHAEYCLKIITNKKNVDWNVFNTLSRVVGGVRKSLIFVMVLLPNEDDFLEKWKQIENNNVNNLNEVLKLYQITEISYKRWVPSRNRD